jgi:hypothetical protein
MAAVPSKHVSQDFKKQVKGLLDEWKPIKQGYADLAKRHLAFAKLIVELWETARALDRKSKDDPHRDYMRQQLQVLVQTDDQSILSRWRTIGAQADILLPVAKHLPSDRDHLYQLATAVKKEKPIQVWIDEGKVHPSVSVNDIKFLKSEGARKKSVAQVTRTQSVTFNFSTDVEAKEIVQILRHAFESENFESVIAEKSVIAECETSLRAIYARLKPKFIDATPPKAPSKPRKRRNAARK